MGKTFKDRKDNRERAEARKVYAWQLNAVVAKAKARRVHRGGKRVAIREGVAEVLS